MNLIDGLVDCVRGDLWLMSTPNGKRGFFWDEWDHGGEEWERISVPATECPRSRAVIDAAYQDYPGLAL
jgi:hypothetical protein